MSCLLCSRKCRMLVLKFSESVAFFSIWLISWIYHSSCFYMFLIILIIFNRKPFQALGPCNYDIRTRCGHSSSPLSRRFQLSSYPFHHGERYRSLIESRRHYATNVVQEKKSQKMLMYLTALVFGMVGCSYAAVPLYRRFCQATGYGGTVQRREVRLVLLLKCDIIQ